MILIITTDAILAMREWKNIRTFYLGLIILREQDAIIYTNTECFIIVCCYWLLQAQNNHTRSQSCSLLAERYTTLALWNTPEL